MAVLGVEETGESDAVDAGGLHGEDAVLKGHAGRVDVAAVVLDDALVPVRARLVAGERRGSL